MGPGPSIIGHIIEDCIIICAGCAEDVMTGAQCLPVTFNGLIYEGGGYDHATCEHCNEILDDTVEICDEEDCHLCGYKPAIEAAIELVEQAQIENIADHATGVHVPGEQWRFEWDSEAHELADGTLDNVIAHLNNLL